MCRTLHFRYRTQYTFDYPVTDHYYTFKIYPRENARQQVISLVEEMDFGDSHSYSFDEFGNKTVYGAFLAPHTGFCFDISGTVAVDDARHETDDHLMRLFCAPSSMTRVTPILRETLNQACLAAPEKSCSKKSLSRMNVLEQCSYLSDYCHEILTYSPHSTDVSTDASGALAQKKGVCQDYSHILIAFLRMLNIPARYVVGLMLGEGFTHAWVEVYSNGMWHGFDPTNCRLVDDTYIKLSHGRDYNDTTVCKGHFTGSKGQRQEISVKVTEKTP